MVDPKGCNFMIKNRDMAISLFAILSFGILWYLICYYQLPRGDDVLTQFSKGITLYVDNTKPILGDKITSLDLFVEHLTLNYQLWTGRIIGLILIPLLTIFGQQFTAIMSSVIYSLIVINVSFLIWDKGKNNFEILNHPLEIIFLHMIIFGLGKYMGYMTMWTFVSIYAVSALLYLMLLNSTVALCKTNFNNTFASVIGLNVLGLIAGLSHEVIGAVCILMILTECLLIWKNNKHLIYKILRNYFGLGVGYIICFTAPGNFNRMQQLHDSGIDRAYLIKVKSSIWAHLAILPGNKYILGILIIVALLYFFYRTSPWKTGLLITLLMNNYIYLLGMVFSIAIWGAASYVPSYGLLFYMCLVCIVLFRTYDDCCMRNIITANELISNIKRPIALMFCLMFLAYNAIWIASLITVTNERHCLIEAARYRGDEVVSVPQYPEIVNNVFTLGNYVNRQKEFDTEYYIKYFGVHILIE